jgi:hypothetical protein
VKSGTLLSTFRRNFLPPFSLFSPEDGGRKFLPITGSNPTHSTASHFREISLSCPPPQEGVVTLSKPLRCVQDACNSRCLLGNDYGNTAQLRSASMTHSRSVVDTGLRKNCKYCDGVQLVVRDRFNCNAYATTTTCRRRANTKTNEDCGLVGCNAVQTADSRRFGGAYHPHLRG